MMTSGNMVSVTFCRASWEVIKCELFNCISYFVCNCSKQCRFYVALVKYLNMLKRDLLVFGPKAIIRPTIYFRCFVASVRSHRILITQALNAACIFFTRAYACAQKYLKNSNSDLIYRKRNYSENPYSIYINSDSDLIHRTLNY